MSCILSTGQLSPQEQRFLVWEVRGLYAAHGCSPPRRVVVVRSPLEAVLAGGLAAGLRRIICDFDAPLRDKVVRWLGGTAQRGDELEQAVRMAMVDAESVNGGKDVRGGPYPSFWTAEDRLVWDATSPVPRQALSGGHGDRIVPDPGVPIGFPAGMADWRPALAFLVARMNRAIEAAVWREPGKPGEDDNAPSSMSAFHRLCTRIFGSEARIGYRLARLAIRMLNPGPLADTGLGGTRGAGAIGGPRLYHADFCMVSDRPERLTFDDQDRAHSPDGPFCRWRDGFSLYAVHGVEVAPRIVERPETLTLAEIDAERNAEVRRVMIERFRRPT